MIFKHSLHTYLQYVLKKSLLGISYGLQPIERYLAGKYGESEIHKYPPVFIIGAPRCGSTLLYKVLTERYYFTFLSNFTAPLYRIPIIGTWMQKKLNITLPQGNYTFHYGIVAGAGAPCECGQFWYRWFPKGLQVYVGRNQTPTEILCELRHEIGGMSYVNQYPMIFKNLYNSMRIAPILEAIPEACFIVCKRDIYQQAFSILDGRVKNLHTKERWWSLPPKEIEQLIGRHYAEQIVGQIFCTYRQIEQDIRDWGENRFFEVCYEEFCEDVYGTLTSIERFLARHGCILKKRWQVPDRFDVQRREMNPEDLRFIQQARDRWGDA